MAVYAVDVHPPMSRPAPAAPAPSPTLWLVPGERLVFFMLQLEQGARACLVLPPGQLLVGLRAARALLSFGAVQCAEMPPEELLPWAGNV